MRKITIEGVLNGWVITVGCQVLVSEDKDRMLKELSRYIDNPKLVEEEYLSHAKNKPDCPMAPEPTSGMAQAAPERVNRIERGEGLGEIRR